jgi:serine/threonine-protein kinase 24/25/MST4
MSASSLQLIERVGAGAYGAVWKAVDRASGATVAVKIVPADGADGGAAAVAAEVAHLLRCACSELVVNYLATRAAAGGRELLIVQEWCGGGSADELLRCAAAARRALSEEEVADHAAAHPRVGP